jgi:hypothetical protein
MSRKRHKPEEIVSKLRQVDVLVAQGTPVADAVRSIGVTEVSCDRKLATALQYSPAACVSGLPTAGPGGVRARLRGLAGCAHPTSFAGQKPRSAKTNPALTVTPDHTSGSFAVRFGICVIPLSGCASGACACWLQSRRADGFDRHRIVAAAAGVCRSTQTGSAAHSSSSRSAQTSSRSHRGYAGAVRRARGA